jgi:hypothetical protein
MHTAPERAQDSVAQATSGGGDEYAFVIPANLRGVIPAKRSAERESTSEWNGCSSGLDSRMQR